MIFLNLTTRGSQTKSFHIQSINYRAVRWLDHSHKLWSLKTRLRPISTHQWSVLTTMQTIKRWSRNFCARSFKGWKIQRQNLPVFWSLMRIQCKLFNPSLWAKLIINLVVLIISSACRAHLTRRDKKKSQQPPIRCRCTGNKAWTNFQVIASKFKILERPSSCHSRRSLFFTTLRNCTK